jgi:hypothetical protein
MLEQRLLESQNVSKHATRIMNEMETKTERDKHSAVKRYIDSLSGGASIKSRGGS